MKNPQLFKSKVIFTEGPVLFLGSSHLSPSGALGLPEQVMQFKAPEVAFCGQSNVGKSTLIKALLGNNDIVKTSRKPGHTKALNFFSISNDRLRIVDMPGYGLNSRTEWGQMALKYFEKRSELSRVYLLRDITKSFKQEDKDIIQLLTQLAVPFQLVLTKCDRYPLELAGFKEKVVAEAQEFVTSASACCVLPVLETGVHKTRHIGIDELRLSIMKTTR